MDTQSQHPTPQPDDLPRNGGAPDAHDQTAPFHAQTPPRAAQNGAPYGRNPANPNRPAPRKRRELDRFGVGNAEHLTPRQALALPIIAASPSLAAASRSANVSLTTLRRWMQDPRFCAELDRIRKDAAELAFNEIQALALKSVNALFDLLDSPNERSRAFAIRTSLHLARQIDADRNIKNRLDILDNTFALIQDQQ